MASLKITRGTRYDRTLSAYQKNGVVTSLVGATVRFTMKKTEFDTDDTDTTAVVKKNITNGTALGVAIITLLPADTQDLAPGKYYYDIKVDEQTNGLFVYKVDEGTITLDGSPTNRLA